MSAVKKIVESIDNKDVSALAENFHEAIAPKIMERIQAESVKAFDKEIDKLDDESDESDDSDKEDDEEDDDLQEAVKLGKPESLNFGRELDLNKAEKEKPSQMTGDLYDAIVKKLFKGTGSVTNKEAATSKNKIDINTKNRHRIVSVVGGYVKEQDRGDGAMGTKTVTKYYKIG